MTRGNLTSMQRAKLALQLETVIAARAKERQREHGGTAPGRNTCVNVDTSVPAPKTRDEIAKLAGVSSAAVQAEAR